MTTENEQPADEESGLDVDLGKVFDEVTQAEEQPELEQQPAEKEPKVEEETPLEPELKEKEPKEEEPAEEKPDEVAPPATWTAEAKEKFGDLDPILKDEILKREKDFAQGIQKYAEQSKQAEAYEQVVSPYKAMIASEGATPQQAVASLLNTAYQLRAGTPEQKGKLILQLANQYGADLSQLNPSEDDEYVDPEIRTLKDELASLKQQTQTQMQTVQQQQLQALQNEINAFASDPKNEHFDKVSTVMSGLIKSGTANTLEEAYEKSLYLVPEVREAIILKQVKEKESARIAKEKEATQKAKKAQGVQLRSEDAGVTKSVEGSMEDDLAAAYDAAQSK